MPGSCFALSAAWGIIPPLSDTPMACRCPHTPVCSQDLSPRMTFNCTPTPMESQLKEVYRPYSQLHPTYEIPIDQSKPKLWPSPLLSLVDCLQRYAWICKCKMLWLFGNRTMPQMLMIWFDHLERISRFTGIVLEFIVCSMSNPYIFYSYSIIFSELGPRVNCRSSETSNF